MKTAFTFLLGILFFSVANGQQTDSVLRTPDPNKKLLVVQTACGECQFKLDGKGCHLAVRLNDKAYFVDGTDIDSHGDAHAKDGFCNAVRKAEIQGEIINNRYQVTYFKLLKDAKDANIKKAN